MTVLELDSNHTSKHAYTISTFHQSTSKIKPITRNVTKEYLTISTNFAATRNPENECNI